MRRSLGGPVPSRRSRSPAKPGSENAMNARNRDLRNLRCEDRSAGRYGCDSGADGPLHTVGGVADQCRTSIVSCYITP